MVLVELPTKSNPLAQDEQRDRGLRQRSDSRECLNIIALEPLSIYRWLLGQITVTINGDVGSPVRLKDFSEEKGVENPFQKRLRTFQVSSHEDTYHHLVNRAVCNLMKTETEASVKDRIPCYQHAFLATMP